jgi:hypothetical protein
MMVSLFGILVALRVKGPVFHADVLELEDNFIQCEDPTNYKVEEDEVGGTCGTNGREEERV